jgi:hypothetical protein
MATNFPTNIDTLTNPTATDKVSVVSHADQHINANDSIEALETKVGVDGSAVTTTHDYKLSNVEGSDKAVSLTGTETLTNKTLTSPTITGGTQASPAITTPTGIVKGDVGLGNVANAAQVELAGDQTIAGVKTFSSSPIVPTPTTDLQVVNKSYVDNAGSGDTFAIKTSDQTVNSSIVPVDDTQLFLPVLANDIYAIKFVLRFNAATTPDYRYKFTIPAAATIVRQQLQFENTSEDEEDLTTDTIPGATGNNQIIIFDILYIGGANAGNIQFQFAQRFSDAGDTTTLANSYLRASKLN